MNQIMPRGVLDENYPYNGVFQGPHIHLYLLLSHLYSGCTMKSMWGNPVPKYAPSVWWCLNKKRLFHFLLCFSFVF